MAALMFDTPRTRLFSLLSLLCLLLLAGCPQPLESGTAAPDAAQGTEAVKNKTPEKPVELVSVTIDTLEFPSASASEEGAYAHKIFQERLNQTTIFKRAGTKYPAKLKARFRAHEVDSTDGSGRVLASVMMYVTMDVTVPGKRLPKSFRAEAALAEDIAGAEDRKKALTKVVESAVDHVTTSLAAQAQLLFGSDAEVVALLDNKQPVEVIKLAIYETRLRRLKEAAGPLRLLLKHDNREVVNTAGGALGLVGERSDVPQLIELATRVSEKDRLPFIFALGELGGTTATTYLETLKKEAGPETTLGKAADHALRRARNKTSGKMP